MRFFGRLLDHNVRLCHQWGGYYGVDPLIVEAITWQESDVRDIATWEPTANEFAWGRMQILGSTARDMGFLGALEALLAPENGVRYGTAYLADRLRIHEDLFLAVDAYNKGTPAGPHTEYVRGVLSHIGRH